MKKMTQNDEVLATSDEDTERPIPNAWRQQFREIVDVFADGDFGLARGVKRVSPPSAETASHIQSYIEDYGATLVALP